MGIVEARALVGLINCRACFCRENFFQEVRVMSRLLHGNIVRLLAVCTETEPFSMITEYMERGDLHQYLRTFSDDLKPSPGKNFIRL